VAYGHSSAATRRARNMGIDPCAEAHGYRHDSATRSKGDTARRLGWRYCYALGVVRRYVPRNGAQVLGDSTVRAMTLMKSPRYKNASCSWDQLVFKIVLRFAHRLGPNMGGAGIAGGIL
jgi:hypothetical protein